jgi:hypothetical protein
MGSEITRDAGIRASILKNLGTTERELKTILEDDQGEKQARAARQGSQHQMRPCSPSINDESIEEYKKTKEPCRRTRNHFSQSDGQEKHGHEQEQGI